MDYVSIVETVVGIASIGIALYSAYRHNVKGHKTTQGKIDAAGKTIADNQTMIHSLENDIKTIAQDVKDIKGKP